MTQKKTEAGDLLRDTLDMLILTTLSRGEMHGYDIAEYIHETSNNVPGVEEGALYPALHRLEVRGLLAEEWGMSDKRSDFVEGRPDTFSSLQARLPALS